jgi:hypothetical protein
MAPEHYEVELRQITYADDGSGVLKITDEGWRPVRVLRTGSAATPLVFGSLDEARGYADRDRPGTVRIVRVTEDGEREVVETGRL